MGGSVIVLFSLSFRMANVLSISISSFRFLVKVVIMIDCVLTRYCKSLSVIKFLFCSVLLC